jgi:hypothetical protein
MKSAGTSELTGTTEKSIINYLTRYTNQFEILLPNALEAAVSTCGCLLTALVDIGIDGGGAGIALMFDKGGAFEAATGSAIGGGSSSSSVESCEVLSNG